MLLIRVALKTRGARGLSPLVEGDGVPGGSVVCSIDAGCRFGLKSASAACRALWACSRCGTRVVCCRSSGKLILPVKIVYWAVMRLTTNYQSVVPISDAEVSHAGCGATSAYRWLLAEPS